MLKKSVVLVVLGIMLASGTAFSHPMALSEAQMEETGGGEKKACIKYGYCAQLCTNILIGRKSYLVHGYYQGTSYGHYYCENVNYSSECFDNLDLVCGLRVDFADYNCTGGVVSQYTVTDKGCG